MSQISANQAVAARVQPGVLGLYLELAKARLSALVLLTTAVGFVMASGPATGFAWLTFAWTLAGTALAAAAANALNELFEVDRDALMHRTQGRPLPSGHLSHVHGLAFALATGCLGVLLLGLLVNVAAAGLALATIVIYVLAYTPLKPVTPFNTLVGAVCGALPPLIGWVAVAGRVESGGLILAGLLFVWQIPHFFALAWLYRKDYARGGFAMLPVVDRSGRLTGRLALGAAVLLLPFGPAATFTGQTGWFYAAASVALGGWLVYLSGRFLAGRTDRAARRLFLATIIYLPVLLCLMVVDRV